MLKKNRLEQKLQKVKEILKVEEKKRIVRELKKK